MFRGAPYVQWGNQVKEKQRTVSMDGNVQGHTLRRKALSKGEIEGIFCPDQPHEAGSRHPSRNLNTNHILNTVMPSSD